MSVPDTETQVKVSSEVAQAFVSRFYEAVGRHQPLLPFYINSTTRYTTKADISINGAVLEAPADYFNLLVAQGKDVFYHPESFDTHVVNPLFAYNAPDNIPDRPRRERSGDMMSMTVLVTGRMRFGKGKDAPEKNFTDSFILVPNWEAMQRNPPRGIRSWLIMSQNFRAL